VDRFLFNIAIRSHTFPFSNTDWKQVVGSERMALFYPALKLEEETLGFVTDCPENAWAIGMDVFCPKNGTAPETPLVWRGNDIYGVSLLCSTGANQSEQSVPPLRSSPDLELDEMLEWSAVTCDKGQVRTS
jgi:hypothetical protein